MLGFFVEVYIDKFRVSGNIKSGIQMWENELNISIEEAMEQFYMSEVFEKLHDIETGLYIEGSAYIYELLKREKQKN